MIKCLVKECNVNVNGESSVVGTTQPSVSQSPTGWESLLTSVAIWRAKPHSLLWVAMPIK